MDVRAKIKKKYLDKILSGKKTMEFRQFEEMYLTDENGRRVVCPILNISAAVEPDVREFIEEVHDDIEFDQEVPIYIIVLGAARLIGEEGGG